MGQTLYLDCFAGISGDMVTGCLLDLGADREKLEKALQSMALEGKVLNRELSSLPSAATINQILSRNQPAPPAQLAPYMMRLVLCFPMTSHVLL